MPKINSLEVVHQDTNADKYDNLHDLLVKFKKFYDESAGREVVDAEARAAYEVLMEMYVNDKEAFARRVETLSAEFGNSLAQVVEEMLVYASKSEAWAKKISTVEAELGSAKASIETESYVRVTEDEALASQITTVESSLGTEIASVQTYAETLATTKNRTFRQTSEPNSSSGRIAGDLWFDTDNNNQAYRFDGVSWVATDDTRIATTYARWGVQVDAGGNVAGIQLNSSGAGSSNFIVLADNFKVYRAGYTSAPIFTTGTVGGVATVGIKGNLVVDGTITTSGVADNAINRPVTSSIGATSVSTSETVYMSVSLTTTVASTIFASSSFGMGFPAGPVDSRFNLKINGTQVATMHTGGAYVQSIALSGALAVSAGTHTVTVTGWKSGAATVEIESGTVYGVGIQK